MAMNQRRGGAILILVLRSARSTSMSRSHPVARKIRQDPLADFPIYQTSREAGQRLGANVSHDPEVLFRPRTGINKTSLG